MKDLLLALAAILLAVLIVCSLALAEGLWELRELAHESRALVAIAKEKLPDTIVALGRATGALETAAQEAGARAKDLKPTLVSLQNSAKKVESTARQLDEEILPALANAARRTDSLLEYAQETLPGTVAQLDAILQRIGAASDQWAQSSIEHKKSANELTAAIAAARELLQDPNTRALPEDVHRLLVQAEKAAHAGKISLASSIVLGIIAALK